MYWGEAETTGKKGSKAPCTGRFCSWKESCRHYRMYVSDKEKYKGKSADFFVCGDKPTSCIGTNRFTYYIPVDEGSDMRGWKGKAE